MSNVTITRTKVALPVWLREQGHTVKIDVVGGRMVYIVNGEEIGYTEAAEKYGFTQGEQFKVKNV